MTKFLVPAILLVAVLIIATVAFTSSMMKTDPPTAASSEARLMRAALPDSLPPLASDTGSGDSTRHYERAIELYVDKADFLATNPPPAKLIEDLTDAVLKAGAQGPPRHGWADDRVGLLPGKQPDWYGGPTKIADIIFDNAIRSQSSGGKFTGSKAKARKVIDAVFLMGKRLYEQSDRVLIRREGLDVMSAAAGMRELALGETAEAGKWREAIFQVRQKWEDKLQAIYALNASVGDLIRFAELDQDPAFQVEAILQLGVAQWTRRSMGNKRVITNSLQGLAQDKNAAVAKAAKAALAMEDRGDVHKAY